MAYVWGRHTVRMTTHSSRSTRRRRPLWPLIVAAFVLVGAGIAIGVIAMDQAKPDPQGITADQLQEEAQRKAALPKCAEAFREGQKIDQDKVKGGCLNPDGGEHLPGSARCGDGRYLWTVAASSGAKEGWGLSGDPYTLTQDAASDPAFRRAYDACNS